MKLIPNLSKIVLVVLTANILMLCGCSKNKQNQESQAKQMKASEQSDKVPKDLENIESSIEKIIKTLGGPSVTLKEEKNKKKDRTKLPKKLVRIRANKAARVVAIKIRVSKEVKAVKEVKAARDKKLPSPQITPRIAKTKLVQQRTLGRKFPPLSIICITSGIVIYLQLLRRTQIDNCLTISTTL